MSREYIRNMAKRFDPTPLESYEPGCTRDEFFGFLNQACQPVKKTLFARQLTAQTVAANTDGPLCSWQGCPKRGEYGAYRECLCDGKRFRLYCEEHIKKVEVDNLLGNQEQN